MASCGITEMPISKGDKLSKEQCRKSELERRNMEGKPYASLVGSLMYAQVCARPDLAFSISVLGRFQSDAGVAHMNVAKRVLRYLQRTKEHMLIYRKTDELVLKGYSDSNFAGCPDDLKSTSGLSAVDYPLNKAVPIVVFKNYVASMGLFASFDDVN
ncbi:secreted RxLR effector protein 161-like [Malus domestica]|uniref:secreted RxLR effector protein 161-like n=1 Tax=Malus domestica TaxID=3750 RepID=UPI003976DB22